MADDREVAREGVDLFGTLDTTGAARYLTGQMARSVYGSGKRAKRISRFNFVKLFVFLVLGALGYIAWKFVPPYWEQFEVKGEIANVAYAAARGHTEEDLRPRIYDAVHKLGIELLEAPEFHWTKEKLTIVVHYQVVIEHPALLDPTVLDFTPATSVSILPPDW